MRSTLTSQVEEIVMLELVDSLELTTNVELLSGMEEVVDTGVKVIIAAKDLLGFEHPSGETDGLVQATQATTEVCRDEGAYLSGL